MWNVESGMWNYCHTPLTLRVIIARRSEHKTDFMTRGRCFMIAAALEHEYPIRVNGANDYAN